MLHVIKNRFMDTWRQHHRGRLVSVLGNRQVEGLVFMADVSPGFGAKVSQPTDGYLSQLRVPYQSQQSSNYPAIFSNCTVQSAKKNIHTVSYST